MQTQGKIATDLGTEILGFEGDTKRKERVFEVTNIGHSETMGYATSEENAAELVRRWNAFEPGGLVAEMAEALGLLLDRVESAPKFLEAGGIKEVKKARGEAVASCRAVLAKYKGEAV